MGSKTDFFKMMRGGAKKEPPKPKPGAREPLTGPDESTSELKPRKGQETAVVPTPDQLRRDSRRTGENETATVVPENLTTSTQELDGSEIVESIDVEVEDDPTPVTTPEELAANVSNPTQQLDLDDEAVEISSKDITDETGTKTWEDMNVDEKLEALYTQTSAAIGILQVMPEEIKAEAMKSTLELIRAALGNEEQNQLEKRITRQLTLTDRKTNMDPGKLQGLFNEMQAIKNLLGKSVSFDLMLRVEQLEAQVTELNKQLASGAKKPK
jgi:hypothetical protein